MSAIESILSPPLRDLGDGFQVKRALPAAQRRTVGPFVFFDQMGPAQFKPGVGLDVRPHPHIGLATVTYLFDGEIMHRDSLGTVQAIRPGEVNWMIAGSGIVHSERTDALRRGGASTLAGIQCWVALPREREEMAASFSHHAADELPAIEDENVSMHLIAGSFQGVKAPVSTLSEMFYADARLGANARLSIAAEHEERAIYVVDGQVNVGGQDLQTGKMAILTAGHVVTVLATSAAHIMLLGGAALDGPRHLWWNFVSSSPERIQQAKEDWRAGRFDRVPGDDEYIPLPASSPPPKPVNYP
jgi:redox-sensitive bicupin YhaK (pirin superfamily)